MTPFCASCLADDPAAALAPDRLDGRDVVLCRECSSGSLRGGRWSFGKDDGGVVGYGSVRGKVDAYKACGRAGGIKR